MNYISQPLFNVTKEKPVIAPLNGPIIAQERVSIINNITNLESIVDLADISDRYILINKTSGERYVCKFYNKEDDKFIGASLLAMYNLNEHFDRNIIKEDV